MAREVLSPIPDSLDADGDGLLEWRNRVDVERGGLLGPLAPSGCPWAAAAAAAADKGARTTLTASKLANVLRW